MVKKIVVSCGLSAPARSLLSRNDLFSPRGQEPKGTLSRPALINGFLTGKLVTDSNLVKQPILRAERVTDIPRDNGLPLPLLFAPKVHLIIQILSDLLSLQKSVLIKTNASCYASQEVN